MYLFVIMVLLMVLAAGFVIGRTSVRKQPHTQLQTDESMRRRLAVAWEEGRQAGLSEASATLPHQTSAPAATSLQAPTPSKRASVPPQDLSQPTATPEKNLPAIPAQGIQQPPVLPPRTVSPQSVPGPPPAGSIAPPASPVPSVVQRGPVANVPTVPPPPPLTPEEKATLKQKRIDRNINITLYAASLLVVTAAALFLGAAFSVFVRFAVLIAVMLVFVCAGFLSDVLSRRLRPASIAFVGTGIAMLPLVGWAISEMTNIPLAWTWALTSVLGLAMTVAMAVRFDTTVGIYLALPFAASAAMASGIGLQQGLIWGYVLLAVAGLIATVLLWKNRDRYRGDSEAVLVRASAQLPISVRGLIALEQTTLFAIPVVLASSILMLEFLDASDYFILSLVSTIYFVVVGLMSPEKLRPNHIALAYISGGVAVLSGTIAAETEFKTSVTALGLYTLAAALSQYIKGEVVAHKSGLELAQKPKTVFNFGFWGFFGAAAIFGITYQIYSPWGEAGMANPTWILAIVLWTGLIIRHLRQPYGDGVRIAFGLSSLFLLYPAVFFYGLSKPLSISHIALAILWSILQWGFTPRSTHQQNIDASKFTYLQITLLSVMTLTAQLVDRFVSSTVSFISVIIFGLTVWALATVLIRKWHYSTTAVRTGTWFALGLVTSWLTLLWHIEISNQVPETTWHVIFGLPLILLMLSGWLHARMYLTNTILLISAGASTIFQLQGLIYWKDANSSWWLVAAVALLAVTFFAYYAHPATPRQRAWTISLLALGQVSLTISVVLALSAAGFSASWQRLVPAIMLTLGAVFAAQRLARFGFIKALVMYRWAVLVIVVGLSVFEVNTSFHRGVHAAFMGLIVLNAMMIGYRGFALWLATPAVWGMLWGFSQPSTTVESSSLATLSPVVLSSITLLLGVMLTIWVLLQVRHGQAMDRVRDSQNYAMTGVWLLLGWATSWTIPAESLAQIFLALFILLAATWTLATVNLTRYTGFLVATAALALLAPLHIVGIVNAYTALNTGWQVLVWSVSSAVILYVFALLSNGLAQTPVIDKQRPSSWVRTNASRIVLRRLGSLVLLLGSLLSLMLAETAILAVVSAVVLIGIAWTLCEELVHVFRNLKHSVHVHWGMRTSAFSLSLVAITRALWVITAPKDSTTFVIYSLVGTGTAFVVWSLRFLTTREEAGRSARGIWSISSLAVANTLILLSSLVSLGADARITIHLVLVLAWAFTGAVVLIVSTKSTRPWTSLVHILAALLVGVHTVELGYATKILPQNMISDALVGSLVTAAVILIGKVSIPGPTSEQVRNAATIHPRNVLSWSAYFLVVLGSSYTWLLPGTTWQLVIAIVLAVVFIWFWMHSMSQTFDSRPATPVLWRSIAMTFTIIGSANLLYELLPRQVESEIYWALMLAAVMSGVWSLVIPASESAWRFGWKITAASLVTCAALIPLMDSSTALMQIATLAGFALVLSVGVLTDAKTMTYWGAAGISLSVLWALRGLTFLWVGLIGIGLIVLAIWQLRRTSQKRTEQVAHPINNAIGVPGWNPQVQQQPVPPPPPSAPQETVCKTEDWADRDAN